MVIKGYHTDNGMFNSSDFMEELLDNQKKIRFNGDGASHKNGSPYCTIKTLVNMTRTMLMHAVLICPENTFSTDIW